MTKVQMKNTAIELMAANKANKALTEAITELMETYVASANRDTVKREREIEIDGTTYRWCVRHEAYEPTTNFRTDKDNYCRLAVKVWSHLGKLVNEASDTREAAIETQNYDALPALTEALNKAKEIRGGRYNYEDNKTQFPEVADYQYDALIQEEAV